MQGVAVTLLTEDRERLSVLQHRLEVTGMGRNVFSHVGFPSSPTDPVLRQIQDVRAEVVLVDIDAHNPARAISAIELIQANTSEIAIFAVGALSDALMPKYGNHALGYALGIGALIAALLGLTAHSRVIANTPRAGRAD